MKSLIITDDIRKASFVQSALFRENLNCDLVRYYDTDLTAEFLFSFDGFFLLLSDDTLVAETLDLIKLHYPGKPVIILSNESRRYYRDLNNHNLIVNFFVYPLPFRLIASEMKYATFRSSENERKSKYILRDLQLDELSCEVKLGNKKLALRNKEFCLLHFFLMNVGRVVSRSAILENVWDMNASASNNTVDVHVSTLRKKIDKDGKTKYIRTVPHNGYIIE